MSYDLLLISKNPNFTHKKFADHLAKTGKVKIDQKEIIYENSFSKVYFYFDFLTEEPNLKLKKMKVTPDKNNPTVEAEVEASGLEEKPTIGFSLNFARPQYFAKEASLVLQNIIQEFDFEVVNLQSDDGLQDFDPELFFKDYDHHSKLSIKAFLEIKTKEQITNNFIHMPRAKQMAIWQWNVDRENWQNQYQDTFVPTLMPCLHQGTVQICFILPPADVSFLVPQQADIMVFTKSKNEKTLYFRLQQELNTVLAETNPFQRQGYSLMLPHTRSAIQPWLLESPKLEPPFQLLKFDNTLDSELLV